MAPKLMKKRTLVGLLVGLIVAYVVVTQVHGRVREGLDTWTGTFNPTTYLAANPNLAATINSYPGGPAAHWNAIGKGLNLPGSGQTKVTAPPPAPPAPAAPAAPAVPYSGYGASTLTDIQSQLSSAYARGAAAATAVTTPVAPIEVGLSPAYITLIVLGILLGLFGLYWIYRYFSRLLPASAPPAPYGAARRR